ncbi:hypothetical protein [Chitinimonas lacunae]|uniref:Uncharacterized protein n=1 Tax=Chitinimonas lacunae TaxID=1963018 RepID=A0ABV8MX24_9NEIS
MQSLKRQVGWYNGMLLLTLVFAVVLFVSQPWIPLLLAGSLALALLVGSLVYLSKLIQQAKDEHHPHHWVLKPISKDLRPIPYHQHGPLPPLV